MYSEKLTNSFNIVTLVLSKKKIMHKVVELNLYQRNPLMGKKN